MRAALNVLDLSSQLGLDIREEGSKGSSAARIYGLSFTSRPFVGRFARFNMFAKSLPEDQTKASISFQCYTYS